MVPVMIDNEIREAINFKAKLTFVMDDIFYCVII